MPALTETQWATAAWANAAWTFARGGSGAITAPVHTLGGSDGSSQSETGAGALAGSLPTTSGAGIRGVVDLGGIANLVSPMPTVSGTGVSGAEGEAITASGALASPKPTVSGAAKLGIRGTGTLTSPAPIVAGAGATSIGGGILDGARRVKINRKRS